MQGRVALVALTLIACSNHTSSSSGAGSATATGGSAGRVASPPAGAPGAGAGSGVATGGDPCRFATKDEVSAATGVTMLRAEQVSPDQCAYYPTASGPANALYVRVSSSDPYAASKQIMHDTVPVAGVGDDALWASPQLLVKAGPKMATIAVMDVRWNHGDSQGAAV